MTIARPSRSPRGSCGSRWRTWPTRSRGSPSRRDTTSPGMRSPRSAARAASTRARSRTRSVSAPCSSRRWPACSPRSGSVWPTPPPCASSRSRTRLEAAAMDRLAQVADDLEEARPRRTARRGRARPSGSGSTRRAQLRYDGTDTAVPVELGRARRDDARRSRRRHRATYSFLMDRPLDRRGALGGGDRPHRTARPVRTWATRSRRRAPRPGRPVAPLHRRQRGATRPCASASGCGPATR